VNIASPKARAYIYGCLVAAGAVALVYGLINAQQLGVWLALGGAVLGLSNGLALANVTPAAPAQDDETPPRHAAGTP
jgi:hypothetical protein